MGLVAGWVAQPSASRGMHRHCKQKAIAASVGAVLADMAGAMPVVTRAAARPCCPHVTWRLSSEVMAMGRPRSSSPSPLCLRARM